MLYIPKERLKVLVGINLSAMRMLLLNQNPQSETQMGKHFDSQNIFLNTSTIFSKKRSVFENKKQKQAKNVELR